MNLNLIDEIREKHSDSNWLFISLGFLNRRAHVFKIKNNNYAVKNIQNEVLKLSRSGHETEWIRADFLKNQEEVTFTELLEELPKIRRNYIDFGISFDSSFTLSFLPEEINANAFVRPIPGKDHQSLFVCERNINTYLKKFKSYRGIYFHKKYANKNVIKFYTQGYLLDGNELLELIPDGNMHGIRKVEAGKEKEEYGKMIKTATNYLLNQVKDNGKYEYGKFPHFDKKIGFYNVLRHASSTYSLLEGLEYLEDESGIEKAKETLDYLLENNLYVDPAEKDAAYIFDDTKQINEIKLGQNGVALIALVQYMNMTGSKEYLETARKLARGTMRMIGEEGDTVHVLNYPELTVKEEKRVIYYDGEAAFGLMRLYQLDENPEWLEYVEILFNHFIENDYWKYSDHWLSYCTYELSKVKPEEKYFIFGLKNVSKRLKFIYQRETTFPTFLEMLMAGYRMVDLMKEKGMHELVAEYLDEEMFNKTIGKRAEYQRTGYFYPEVSMYFKNPESILGSFFIKHHGYRVRIDDVQHYISGYIQYMRYFKLSN
ncbi:hypothetical protein SAMN05216187_10824 [Jeotgalicoccus aerolatus]|uniref:Poly(Glycerol-phosphate) alpha-glucosyltransferase n=1 Tax=Jeotgalicoccus aerolatus TaxID=709510 RepID=A0A1G9BIL1_9STAP|nr:poly(glycerol-phosphate) alpha-glucosyltransferase [Jeotgalicoccus aerolatus]SDK39352.1 hypothetical protein SAMN05216187_10824 [Jeotgalicoccus aerolatus]